MKVLTEYLMIKLPVTPMGSIKNVSSSPPLSLNFPWWHSGISHLSPRFGFRGGATYQEERGGGGALQKPSLSFSIRSPMAICYFIKRVIWSPLYEVDRKDVVRNEGSEKITPSRVVTGKPNPGLLAPGPKHLYPVLRSFESRVLRL